MLTRFLLVVLTGAFALAQAPVVSRVFNNYSGSTNIAQGAIFVITGTNFADQPTTTLQNVPLQTLLRNVQVRIIVPGTTLVAPLYYAFNNQIAGILPSNTPVGTAFVVVFNNGKESAPTPITVVRSAFGMVVASPNYLSSAAVHDEIYALLANQNATNPGRVVVLYGSGLGATSGDETVAQTGSNASGDLTSIPIAVTVGERPAQVLYRGRTAFPGLDQINIVVPALDTEVYGCSVPVRVTSNGVLSNIGTIPVAASGTFCPLPPLRPTPAEINRWTSAQGFTMGTLGLSHSEAGVSSLRGGFFRVGGIDAAAYARSLDNPDVGQCTVFPPGQASSFRNLTFNSLQAGPEVTAAGPGGTLVAPLFRELNNTYNGGANPGLAAGRYVVSSPPGLFVGPFSAPIDVGSPLVWTNREQASTVVRADGLTVEWSGGAGASTVTITGEQSQTGISLTTFRCVADRAVGRFTIPASVLTQFPASPVATGLPVQRGTLSLSASSFVRTVAGGIDYLTISSTSGDSTSTQYK